MTRSRIITFSVLAVAFVIGIGGLFVSAPSVADDNRGNSPERRHGDNDIAWNPASLSVSLKPGETRQIPVTFTAREKIDDGTIIYASTSLKDIIKVSPTTFGPLRKGQTATITVTVTLPILQGAGTINGFIQLYDDGKRWKGKREQLERKLPIAVTVVWASATVGNGVSVKIPGTLVLDPQSSSAVALLVPVETTAADRRRDVPRISIKEIPNPSGLPFGQFFNGVNYDYNWAGSGADIESVSSIVVQGRNAFKVLDGSMNVIVVVPKAQSFIVVTDGGMAYQASGEFQKVLDNFNIGAP